MIKRCDPIISEHINASHEPHGKWPCKIKRR